MPTLILGKGIEPLQFGMSTEKVQEVFGAPEDTYEKTDTPSWYYYEPHSIALYFDENKKLRSIAVKHDSSIVRGIDFYGQTEEELQQSIESLDIGVLEAGYVQSGGRMKDFSVPSAGLFFQLRHGFVYRVRIEAVPPQASVQ